VSVAAARYKHIRSFSRRGRLTPAQQIAFDTLVDVYCVSDTDVEGFFKSLPAAVVLEIGFGNGESLALQAMQHPQRVFVGIEVHTPGIAQLMLTLDQRQIKNVFILQADAVEILSQVPNHVLSAIQIFFPDPWPKLRHHKRRLINTALIDLFEAKLQYGGYVHMATDWMHYAMQMQRLMEQADAFEPYAEACSLQHILDGRPSTKFERRGIALGHETRDLVYRLVL